MSEVRIEKPVHEYPNWLPDEIRQAVESYIDTRIDVISRHDHSMTQNWYREQENIKEVMPCFTNEQVGDIWEKLLKVSPDKTAHFVTALFRIIHEYDTEETTVNHLEKERAAAKTIVDRCLQLRNELMEYDQNYHGYLIEDLGELMKPLQHFIDNVSPEFRGFDEYLENSSKQENSLVTLSRKKHAANAKPNYFARRISAFFRSEFGKPMNRYICNLIEAMFDISYDEDQMKKATIYTKRLIEKRRIQLHNFLIESSPTILFFFVMLLLVPHEVVRGNL